MEIIELIPVVLFTILGAWKPASMGPLMFMLAAGASMMTGLYWWDAFKNNVGLTVSLMLIAYSLACFGLALKCILWQGAENDDAE